MNMRPVNDLKKMMLLAVPVLLATCAQAQVRPTTPSAVRDQLSQATAQGRPVSGQTATPIDSSKGSVTSAEVKSAAASQPAPAPAPKPAPAFKPAVKPLALAVRRDPFDALLNRPQGLGLMENLPPGKSGLVVNTVRIDGIVRGSGGMIAIVSNPQQRTYFLREGDKIFDGSVQHITLEAVSFQEFGKDAFGKPLQRQVTKRLYPSPGEQR